MEIKKLYCVIAVLCAMLAFTSCSENDDSLEEYPEWKATNDAFFSDLYSKVQKKIADGDKSWKIIPSWSMPTEPQLYEVKPENCIIVEVLKQGTGSGCPLYTDRVWCHYQGRLLPSTTYVGGLIFDQSYYGTFNEATSSPTSFLASGVVNGFSTALQNMHIGDKWKVYIPYQLGYGTTQSSGSKIPACSTLIFDIELVKYSRPDAEEK